MTMLLFMRNYVYESVSVNKIVFEIFSVKCTEKIHVVVNRETGQTCLTKHF